MDRSAAAAGVSGAGTAKTPVKPEGRKTQMTDNPKFDAQRTRMVAEQLRGYGVRDERVLEAMGRVPRHAFVPKPWIEHAYADRPLPIGHGQTISQPYMVARMTELAQTNKSAKALDIGTGSGYQAAILGELVDTVYSIEIVCELADAARDRLRALNYENIEVRCGDGYGGWKSQAPFDVIIVAAAPEEIPAPLIEQLAPSGRLLIPVGPSGATQVLKVVEKESDGSLKRWDDGLVRFVPMTGEAEKTH